MPLRFQLSAVLLISSCASATPSQTGVSPSLDSGTVVRVTWSDGARERVRLLAPATPGGTALRFCRYPAPTCGSPGPNPERIRPRAEVVRIDVRHRGRAGHGARVGAAVGLGLGLLGYLGYMAAGQGDGESGNIALVIPLVALEGAAFGALIGAFSDNWAPVE